MMCDNWAAFGQIVAILLAVAGILATISFITSRGEVGDIRRELYSVSAKLFDRIVVLETKEAERGKRKKRS